MSGFKKGIRVVLLLVLCLGVSNAARAADFSLFASGWDTDLLGAGYGAGARLAFGTTHQFQLTGSWFGTLDEEIFGENVLIESFDVEVDAIPLDRGYTYSFGDGTGFYLGAGGTAFFLDSNAGDLDDEFGWFAQIGYQWKNFFVEGLYRSVEGTINELDFGELETSERVVVDLSGPAVNVGWRF
jgi:hypothetical protein